MLAKLGKLSKKKWYYGFNKVNYTDQAKFIAKESKTYKVYVIFHYWIFLTFW
jgi:hypothetical protein